ncbi:MAG TPA: hypothetical protein VGI78_02340 [Acetobacteraceae bacterium]
MSQTVTTVPPAPPGTMQRIPFPLESYQHASKPLSSKYLLNLMAEQAPADARAQVVLIPTAGLELSVTVGSGPIHAINDDIPTRVYVVSGTHFYRLSSPGGITQPIEIEDLGDIGTPSGNAPLYLKITIAVGFNGVVVCVPPNAFTSTNNPGDALNPLGGTFPGNASSVTFLDGYFVFTKMDGTGFFISLLNDPTNFDALDFASLDAFGNWMYRVVTNGLDLWFAGIAGLEIWYDAGAQDFPFRRRPGGFIQHPVASPRSVVVGDGSVFWLGLDCIVCRSNGYQPSRISTNAIEEIIREIGISDINSALVYSESGHVFYALNFTSRTLVYDASTKLWHDRASSTDGTGRWRCDASGMKSFPPQVQDWNGTLLGDYQTGALYVPSPRLATDNGVVVKRQAVMPPLWGGTRRLFCSRLEIEMESGLSTSGSITLDWSDDGGNTWTGGPRVLANPAGQYRYRVFTTRLGSFRQRVFRLTANGNPTMYAVDCAIIPGDS